MATRKIQTAQLLPIVPLKEIVVFPNSITPLFVMRHKSLQALDAALNHDKKLFLLTQRNIENEHPGPEDLFEIGSYAEIIQVLRLPDGSAKVLVEGRAVGRVLEFDTSADYLQGLVEPLEPIVENDLENEALRRTVETQFEQYTTLSDKIPEDLALSIKSLDDPLQLANAIANYCYLKTEDKQQVLQERSASAKLLLLSELLSRENELLELENKIIAQVKGKINKSQKEYFLNEQLKVIEKELGVGGEEDMELEEYEERINSSKMPKEAREKAVKELNRLSKMSAMSPEATVSRTYIDWLLEMPWGKLTQDETDLARAWEVLNEDHFGLKKVKERIVEHLAVMRLVKSKEMRGPILCLVGPPGVGKTSLGRSVARTLKRKFVRISLGGVRDEAEIRGHRRTYIGSMPGKIVQSMKKAGSMNPVFLLDEIDKMNADFRGDPASALLEVLDPEQNLAFNDHYLEVDFDLSKVLFITTANTTSGIPAPLLDRMELIRLPGYTEDEKRKIARGFLIPRQCKLHGLADLPVVIEPAALDKLIIDYTREAGVRTLDREVARLCRRLAMRILDLRNEHAEAEKTAGRKKSARGAKSAAEGKRKRAKKSSFEVPELRVTPELIREWLGPERYRDMRLHDKTEIGVATGLAWTQHGGEILPTEAILMPGTGKIELTGKLGDVMKESARAAISYLRSRADHYKLPKDFHKKFDLHLHFPEGAIPKDGPSAGVTITTALMSVLTQRPVRQDVAMTGEITLRGHVLKIGGLKEKAIAAHRNGIRTILIPADNAPELEEISDDVKADLEFIPVNTIDEVLDHALLKTSARTPRGEKRGPGATRLARKPPRGRARPTAG